MDSALCYLYSYFRSGCNCFYFSGSQDVITLKTGLLVSVLGPVVQNTVSLTTSLRPHLVKYEYMPPSLRNTLLFLLEKCENLICKRFSQFFNKKLQCICNICILNLNETITNEVVNFEQPAPGLIIADGLTAIGSSESQCP